MLKLIFLMMLMKIRCLELNNYIKKDKLIFKFILFT